ncbi:MAG: DUF3592 domain-containing protein [Saccharofermentans sp.]|nr:DUF3592 domain-containing protein [Saccharofermentans sp.]
MFYVIFGGLLVFVGFYLIIKCALNRKKGTQLDATLAGFQEEKGATYPVFSFKYEGEELTLPGGVPANPSKFKYSEGDTVKIVFNSSNRQFVDIAGSATEYLYGIASIVIGAILALVQLKKMGVF